MLVGQLNKLRSGARSNGNQIEKDMALGASGQFALSEALNTVVIREKSIAF